MHRSLPASALAALVLALLLAACGSSGSSAQVRTHPPAATCSPPAGGRCAADVAWKGPILLAGDGRTLHGIVLCGGALSADDTPDRVTVRLHEAAVRAGGMSCARVDVRLTLAEPLGNRPVYDATSGDRLRVVRG